jgi:DNA-binding NarL/FixJ family response regulator
VNKNPILIADDHQMVRMGIRLVLESCPDRWIIEEAANGHEVLSKVRTGAFCMVLTDLTMPGVSGVDLIERIKAEQPDVPILVHSMYADGQTALRALKAGATGYVTKGSDAATLIEGVRRVVRKIRFVSPDLVDEVLSSLGVGGSGHPHEQLSDREFEVFKLFVAGQSVNSIAAGLSLSPKTVSTHKMRLMRKLNAKSDVDLVRYAVAHGLDR